jgi:hypothetical protein
MAAENFKTLDGIFQMFTPVDLVNKQQPNLGGPLEKVDDAFKALLSILESNGRGVLPAAEIKKQMLDLKSNSDPNVTNIDLSKYLTFFTTKEVVDLGPNTQKATIYISKDGTPAHVGSVDEILGKDFVGVSPVTNAPFDVSIILSRSPFFNPATRNTKKAEIFLNSMPSTVLSQLVPFMQVEFQMTRDPADQLQTVSQLKLLMGAVDKTTLKGANKALVQGHQNAGSKTNPKSAEVDYAGMELFTSPQTLTNPQPNKDVGTMGTRYVDVIDPYRPFATLEHVTITARPSGAGFYCYKTANLTLKVHDRSRLAEISDLIRPRVYTGVTLWLTYGWRAPNHAENNPYFSYVNNNMLMREAYHIKNSSFSFDNVGQVVLNLELFTKGVTELREMKISDNKLDMSFRTREIKDLIEQIATYRKRLRLDPEEGLNKEVRVFQILDAASEGEFPDLKADEVTKKIDALKLALNHTPNIDKDAANGLITTLQKLYTPDKNDAKKFSFKERYKTMVSGVIDGMFLEAQSGPDPFLPATGKFAGDDIIKICDSLNKIPATKPAKFRKQAVSFGKLFSVFALRAISSIPDTIDEVQVFFYNLNDQCGPISGHSIAEFPIDMNQFLDQYRQEVIAKGGEKITLEDFIALIINAQFLDNRAIGYGLRSYYEPYASGKDSAIKKDKEGDFETAQAAMSFKYGAFKKPTVEMYIETSHSRVADAGDNDILQALNYSAKDATAVSINDAKGASTKKIMRIHVYDKQTTVHRAAGALLRDATNTSFLTAPESSNALVNKYRVDIEDTVQYINKSTGNSLGTDVDSGRIQKVSPFVNNQQIKDVVSKLVPTIRYGSNGTTIQHANLTSKADPLLSTVNMMRSLTIKNSASPNGSGELGIPLRVIPAIMTMPTWGNPLATMAQHYFIDFQTGTTLDNLYTVTGLTHTFAPGTFKTDWTFGYYDAYGVFEGAPNIIKELNKLSPTVVKDPSNV